MPRLFAALELPSVILEGLAGVRGDVEGARWQRDDQLHLTLAFIGNVEPPVMRDIISQLNQISFTPFPLRLKGVNKFSKDGKFGRDGFIKTLWAGVENPDPVIHLHEKVMQAIRAIGVSLDERRFVPHVTLARFPRRVDPPVQPWLTMHENFRTVRGGISHFTLYSSQGTDEGSYYRPEARFGPGAHLAEEGFDLFDDDAPADEWA